MFKGVIILDRRIKKFGGQHETLPIKNKKLLNEFMFHLLKKYEHAQTKQKKYQAYRNYMIAFIGINTAFRAEDLLQLRVKDVINGYIHIKENKTGKMQNFKMNNKVHQEILQYIDSSNLTSSDYLFMGQKKFQTYKGITYPVIYPITRQQAHKIIKKTGREVGIYFIFGLHSLRKTFGYHYILNGGKPETLMKMYNHDNYDYTMRYVHWGIDDAENDREAVCLGLVKKQSENRKER